MVDAPVLLAGERHISKAVHLSQLACAHHERQPIVGRQLVNLAAIVFLFESKSCFLQILPDRFAREEIEVPWNVLTEKMARSHTAKIGHQKHEQSALLEQPRRLSKVGHWIVYMLEHGPRRHCVVGRVVHGNILKLLRVHAKIRDALRRLRNLHSFHIPSPRRHESWKFPIGTAHIQQFLPTTTVFQFLQVGRLCGEPAFQIAVVTRRRRILVILPRIIFLHLRRGRSRVHESEPALVTFNDRKKFFAEEAAVRHFIHRRVPVYEMPDRRFFREEFFTVVECNQCGLGFVNPRPAAAEMQKYYPREYYQNPATTSHHRYLKRRFTAQAAYLEELEHGGGRKKLLDVGCANGEFPRFMAARGWDVEGVEVSESSQRITDFRVYTQEFQNIPMNDPAYDAVTAWAVLEHVHDPMAYFRKASRLLKQGGLFVFLVPNFGSVASRHLFCEDIPRHLYFFTRETVRQYLQKTGFALEKEDNGRKIYKLAPNNWLAFMVRTC